MKYTQSYITTRVYLKDQWDVTLKTLGECVIFLFLVRVNIFSCDRVPPKPSIYAQNGKYMYII